MKRIAGQTENEGSENIKNNGGNSLKSNELPPLFMCAITWMIS